MKQKLEDMLFKLKTYWKVPPKGYDVTYKEFLNFAIGLGGVSFISVLMQFTGIAVGTYMMISYFKVSTGLVWLIGILTSIINIIRSPILSKIIDNSHSKKGKFKPFLMIGTIGSCVSFGLIPFIPADWCTGAEFFNVFSVNLPAMPIFKIFEPQAIHVSLGVIVLFVLTQFGGFFNTLLMQSTAGVEQTISTVAQERANIGSLKGLISNIPGSVIKVIIPILVGLFFTKEGVDNSVNGYNNINLYRTIFPICAIGGAILMLFMIKGTTERAVINTQKVQKVGFFKSASSLITNKYFWVITIFNCIAGLRELSNITTWLTQYTYASGLGKTLVGLYCNTLLMNVLMVGMILAPILVKKIGKKKLLVYSNIIYSLAIGLQLLFHKNPIMILIVQLFQNVFMGFNFVALLMVSDVLDYHQYKTGKRLEGTWQNLTVIVATVISLGTGMLLPIFLQKAGVGFSDSIAVKLEDEATRYEIYKYQTMLAFIASCVCIVPMLFYNLSEAKHASIIKVLKVRVALDCDSVDELTDKNIMDLHDIMENNKENSDPLLQKELTTENIAKIELALANYDNVVAKVEYENRELDKGNFVRECELGLKKLDSKLRASIKKDNNTDAVAFAKNYKLNHKYLKYFVDTSLEQYNDIDKISKNIEEIYTFYEGTLNKEQL